MRLDDLQESGNVEDRRGEGGGRRRRRLWNSDWRRRAGHRHDRRAGSDRLGASASIRACCIGGAEILTGVRTSRRCKRRQRRAALVTPQRSRRAASSARCSAPPRRRWQEIFARDGRTYQPPRAGPVSRANARGLRWRAHSAMGPFYCPADQKVYLDTSFFDQICDAAFAAVISAAKRVKFSQAYVIAHEVGHHVQNLFGILPKATQAQRTAAASKPPQITSRLRSSCRRIASPASGRIGRMKS